MNKLAKIENKEKFLEKFSIQNSYSIYKDCTTIERCIRSQAPTLSTITKNYSKNFTVKYIQLWLIAMNEFLNISRKMNKAQIEETARLIYDCYYYLNIADLNLFFGEIKRGKYEIYDVLDGAKILRWMDSYVNERLEYSLNSGGIKDQEYIDLTEKFPEIKQIGK